MASRTSRRRPLGLHGRRPGYTGPSEQHRGFARIRPEPDRIHTWQQVGVPPHIGPQSGPGKSLGKVAPQPAHMALLPVRLQPGLRRRAARIFPGRRSMGPNGACNTAPPPGARTRDISPTAADRSARCSEYVVGQQRCEAVIGEWHPGHVHLAHSRRSRVQATCCAGPARRRRSASRRPGANWRARHPARRSKRPSACR